MAGSNQRVIIGSETDDTLKIDLQDINSGTITTFPVTLYDSDGSQVSSFGGGSTQVTDGEAVDASDTGQLILGTDGSNYQILRTNSDGELILAATGGMATAANQTTIIGHVDGIEALLTTIDTDTSSMATDLSTIAGDTTSLDGKDLMLGTDFSTVMGTSSLILATQADDVVNTSDGLQTSTFNYWFDGTTWDRARGDSTNGLLVNLGSNNDVTLATLPDTASSDLASMSADLGTIDTDTGNIAAGFATEGSALGSGVLLQGDDGTDRKNINVDATTGDVQVDVTNTVTVDATSSGDVPITLAGETVTLAANDGTDIGDVDVASLPSDTFVAEGGALGKGVLLQGDDGTDRTNVLVDTSGHLQVDVLTAPSTAVTNAGTFAVQVDAALPAGDNNIGNVDIASSVALDVSAATVTVQGTVSSESDGTALSNNQVSVDTTVGGTTIVSASAGRQGVTITNQGSNDAYIGTGTVSTSNGFLLKAGESIALPTDSEVKGITSSGSTTIGYLAFA